MACLVLTNMLLWPIAGSWLLARAPRWLPVSAREQAAVIAAKQCFE